MTVGTSPPLVEPRDLTLVWIDSRVARIVHADDDRASLQEIHSDVPPRHHATGHVRYLPTVRHGGEARKSGEARRLEHLARFVDLVARRLADPTDVVVLGPGTVRTRLTKRLQELDREHRVTRAVTSAPTDHLTRRQLVERYWRERGEPQRRRSVGAHRWIGPDAVPIAASRRPPM